MATQNCRFAMLQRSQRASGHGCQVTITLLLYVHDGVLVSSAERRDGEEVAAAAEGDRAE